MTNPQDKRLIEYYIPIKAISAEASREKSIRHGHISTLHLWWARRPLVASRAAVFAALVSADAQPQLIDHETGEPYTMNKFMIELCKWKLRDEILDEARRLIREAYPDNPPKVLDMFAGGGAIPLEALRLGADAYALDLNPVAHIIQLATLVYPQKYGKKLAEDVKKWGEWVLERVREEVGDLYPLIPDPDYVPNTDETIRKNQMGLEQAKGGEDFKTDEMTQLAMDFLDGDDDLDWDDAPDATTADVPEGWLQPIAYLWTRTVTCPNPTCRATVPLVRQTWLKKKAKDYVALEMLPHESENRMAFHVRYSTGKNTKEAIEEFGFDPAGYSERGTTTCHTCGTTVNTTYARKEGKSKRIGQQLIAMVCAPSSGFGKVYLSPDDIDLPMTNDTEIEERLSSLEDETSIQAPNELLEGKATDQLPSYGMTRYKDVFTNRQLLTLLTFVKHIKTLYTVILENVEDDEYAKAITTLIALNLSRMTNFYSNLCVLYADGGRGVRMVFVRQALPMVWDFAESNPYYPKAASWNSSMYKLLDALKSIDNNTDFATVFRASAANLPIDDNQLDAIVTDPPYYDNVQYADLSDYFYVWLARTLNFIHPAHFSTDLAPKKKEAVVAKHRHDDNISARQFYEKMMFQSFCEASRTLRPHGLIATIYAHKTTAGWSTLIDAMRNAGFELTQAWPIETEQSHRALSIGTAALASSFFLMGQKRDNRHTGDFMDDVQPEMRRIVKERVGLFLQMGVTGADLNIATVGAGLAPYTRYARVELPNGEELGAADYLEEVQAEVVQVLLGEAGKTDNATQYYIMARDYYGLAWVDFDEANNLARATGLELDTGADALTKGKDGLVEKTGSKIRLRDYSERGDSESLGLPTDAGDAPLVDVLHRLLWLVEHDNRAIESFLNTVAPDKYLLRLTAEALKGKALASEPTPGAVRDHRSPEQRAIDTLLASWRRLIDEGTML